MPYKVTQFQSTPNPNALKCLLDRSIRDPGSGSASWRTPIDAERDPAAAALFSIQGVSNLLINSDWITVGKQPDADWKAIKQEVRRVLETLP